MDAARRLGLSAQAVLDACQSLYETHRLATYPRSDCSYLPEGHLAQASEVLRAIATHAPSLSGFTAAADLKLRSRAWNDKKITAHHAIIPTPNNGAIATLSDAERGVYELVCRRYVSQFYPAHEYLQTRLELTVAGETFVAHGRQVVALGWKALSAEVEPDRSLEPEAAAVLPQLQAGDPVTAAAVTLAERRTEPPKAFSDASLIQAMCNVAHFVKDPSVKKILTETDGIGTPATRASILEILLARGYAARVKKTIRSTPTGRALIQSLPPVATTPEMTAVWEAAMRAIHDGEQTLGAFLTRVTAQLEQLIDQGRRSGPIALPPALSGERGEPAPIGEGKRAPTSKRGARTPS
jgi:DNA topoisomerase-3